MLPSFYTLFHMGVAMLPTGSTYSAQKDIAMLVNETSKTIHSIKSRRRKYSKSLHCREAMAMGKFDY